jgi:hypothetical protein
MTPALAAAGGAACFAGMAEPAFSFAAGAEELVQAQKLSVTAAKIAAMDAALRMFSPL